VDRNHDKSQQTRVFLVVVFGGLILWQVYLVIFNFRMANARDQVFTGLGVQVSTLTQLFISALSLGPAIPIVTLLLAADILRRKHLSTLYGVAALGVAIAITVAYQVAVMEAWFRPMFSLIEQIG